MRLVHTSDWHLGRRLCDVSLVEDQAYALDRLLEVCRDARADALVIAGDVFDRAVPPEDAVLLWDDFVQRVLRRLGIPLVVIPGNHDSPSRLQWSISEPLTMSSVECTGSSAMAPVHINAPPKDVSVRTQPEPSRAQRKSEPCAPTTSLAFCSSIRTWG